MRVMMVAGALGLASLVTIWGTTGPVQAQTQTQASASAETATPTFWIQIEAQPTRADAEERLRDYASRLTNVNGFTLDTGWYAIVLGPFDEATAQDNLRALRAQDRVPLDSFLAQSAAYRSQIWPPGVNALQEPVVPVTSEPVPAPIAQAPTNTLDETLPQARASEVLLDRADREALQVALQWAGYYRSTIDGAFGRGTRGAMSAWQQDNGFDPTGVLTTRQRAALLGQYNALLDGVDLTLRTDTTTGIEMLVPTGLVSFDAYEAPFARYGARDGSSVQLIQISRPGAQVNLFGLYDLLQTLEVVPRSGPRERRSNGFSITGEGADFISQTEVTLRDGAIKGYILVWPRGDDARRTRVLSELERSFRAIDGVLPLDAGFEDLAAPDLISGLEIRQPRKARSGVYIGGNGAVLTAAEAVMGCGRITLDGLYDADLTASDPALGLALVTPQQRLAPARVAALPQQTPRRNAEVAVAGYSYGGMLGAPTLTYGALAGLTGLNGEPTLNRLALAARDGDIGGPVFDGSGALIGVLQPNTTDGRALPDDVAFATDKAALQNWLVNAGVALKLSTSQSAIAPATLTRHARDMTVLVRCWD